MDIGGHVVVRRVDEHMVVIDPTRDAIEVRRSRSEPTPDDTVLERYRFAAISRLELFVGPEDAHRLVLAVGSREGIDLGREGTRAETLRLAKELSRLFVVLLDIRDGDFLDEYVRDKGPVMSRIQDGKHMIDAELVDPIDPWDELSPGARAIEISYDSIERDGFSMDDLMIEIQAGLGGGGYDDGPFAEPRVRTAPEVEAVYPLPTPIDPPPMSAEAEEQVRKSHREPRKPGFERRGSFAWLRAALRALTA